MATLAHLRPLVPEVALRAGRPAAVSPVAVVLVVLATPGPPRGEIPIIGDPIRDLTICKAAGICDPSTPTAPDTRSSYRP